MKHICVMGEGNKAHIVAHNAEELDRKMYKTLIQNGPSLVQNSS
jgi:hypothetical protein